MKSEQGAMVAQVVKVLGYYEKTWI